LIATVKFAETPLWFQTVVRQVPLSKMPIYGVPPKTFSRLPLKPVNDHVYKHLTRVSEAEQNTANRLSIVMQAKARRTS